ncbi:MAG: MBL fold metallo-hydrolase [Lachnospiraceae bacterium]|nr:MBL fold metallo-hydrolase [Lachnospiraceae bacterium]
MEKVSVGGFCLGPVRTNTYIVYRDKSAVIIDPADNGEGIFDAVSDEGLTIEAVLITHAHFDHILGLEGLLSKKKVPVYAAAAEKELCSDADKNQSAVFQRACTVSADHWIEDGEAFTAGGIGFTMIHTPGHTPGSCCYYIDNGDEPLLFSGDTLFQASVGRTDLPGGNAKELRQSVMKLYEMLPDNTHVYPGHGEATWLGFEKKYNPYVSMEG